MSRRIQYRLQGIAPDGTYDVTARIVDQSTIDGEPLDSPLELATDPTGSGYLSSILNTSGSTGSTNPGQSNSGTDATSNPGRGGLLPGGLPIKLPWPTAPSWILWALAAAGILFVVEETRQ